MPRAAAVLAGDDVTPVESVNIRVERTEEEVLVRGIHTDELTGNRTVITQRVSTADSFGDYAVTAAQREVVMRMQEMVYHGWATGTSATTSSVTIPASWWSTGSSATTGNWHDDRCTAAANAVWTTSAWQDAGHTQVRWTPSVIKETPEQAAERAAKAELARQAAVIEAAKVKVFTDTAKARARRLLLSMLNADQRKELEEKNHFHLTVHDRSGSIRVYRIEHGYAGNVKLLGVDGQPIKRYCIHADSRLPYEDQMLAQKLLLEANEEHFLRVANMTQLRAA